MYEKHLYLLGRIQSLVPFWRNSSGILVFKSMMSESTANTLRGIRTVSCTNYHARRGLVYISISGGRCKKPTIPQTPKRTAHDDLIPIRLTTPSNSRYISIGTICAIVDDILSVSEVHR